MYRSIIKSCNLPVLTWQRLGRSSAVYPDRSATSWFSAGSYQHVLWKGKVIEQLLRATGIYW